MNFVQARNYTPGRKKEISLIVLHSMEAAETPTTAEAVANWFAGKSAPWASAHYCVDNNSIVQCVRDKDTAWHAPSVNDKSIGIELAGYAKQSAAEWMDPYSSGVRENAAKLIARLCTKYDIPARFLTADQVLLNLKGITTHYQCTQAYNVKGGHIDPGPNFPILDFIIMVDSYIVYPPTEDF